MNVLCPICAIDSTSHSFYLLYQDEGKHVFYSCPSQASKYNDMDGILSHFKNVLDHYNCSEILWSWIFDFKGFELKHTFEIQIAIGLAKIINNYSKYLTEIRIINTNFYTHSMLRIVRPFLNNHIQNIIKLN